MSRGRVLLAVPLAVALLAGCGSDPADVRREQVAAMTEAANEGDADRLRERAQALISTLDAQREQGDLDEAEAGRLTELAQAVLRSADVIDADLLERRRVEAERKKLEEERKRLEDERRKAEEAARQDEERDGDDKGKGEGKGKGKDDD